MKDKKLIVLYILMLVVGCVLLFSNTSTETKADKEKSAEIQQEIKQEQLSKEIVTVAVAKRDISDRTIMTTADYYFKTMEVNKNDFDKTLYISNPDQINNYVTKNNIEKETIIQQQFIASPTSSEYQSLILKPGEYVFPINIDVQDAYLLDNLKSGDLIDIYITYGSEQNTGKTVTYVSPSRNFLTTNIKPLIVGKKILLIQNNSANPVNSNRNLGQIDIILTNDEIKLLRTIMTNASIVLYPSTYDKSLDDGMMILNEREKSWPLSEKQILNYKPINKLRGN